MDRGSGLRTLSLMLATTAWGTLLGGIAYSHLVYFPAYLSALPASAVVVNGPYGLNESIFWLVIHPLLIVSLVTALTFNWRVKARRTLIGISLTVHVLMLAVTTLYFVPELIAFQQSPNSDLSPSEWLMRARRWERLSWIRGAIAYLAFLPLLLALTSTGEQATSSH